MKTLLFLDDERNFEDVSWMGYHKFKEVLVIRNYEQFCIKVDELLETKQVDELCFSFDHDLADFDSEGKEFTGKDCAKYLVERLMDCLENINHLTWFVHSQNPIGKQNINNYLWDYIDLYNNENML